MVPLCSLSDALLPHIDEGKTAPDASKAPGHHVHGQFWPLVPHQVHPPELSRCRRAMRELPVGASQKHSDCAQPRAAPVSAPEWFLRSLSLKAQDSPLKTNKMDPENHWFVNGCTFNLFFYFFQKLWNRAGFLLVPS